MYITSVTSSRRIVHKPECYHLKNVANEKRIYHNTLKSALSTGCHVCADCLRAEKQFDDNYKKINGFAEENKMTWDITSEGVTIRTKRSSWKIFPGNNGRYKLYHANESGISHKGDEIPGYHNQKVHYASIREYFTYVIDHDNYRKLYPVKPSKRKGTPGYKNQMKVIEKKRKYWKVVNVYNLIDSLSDGSYNKQALSVG